VGCGMWEAGRQAVFGIGRRMGFGAPLFDEVDWKFQADKFYELSHTRLTGVKSDGDKCLLYFVRVIYSTLSVGQRLWTHARV
jgi:hypothetical protein